MNKNEILVKKNMILKLTNLFSKELNENESDMIDDEILKLDNYIQNKGAKPVGPLIQYTNIVASDEGKVKILIIIMKQADRYFKNADKEYKMKVDFKLKNCLYARFIGEEKNIRFAYDKLNLIAYEENIILKGDSYTIIVKKSDEELVADIFMERINND